MIGIHLFAKGQSVRQVGSIRTTEYAGRARAESRSLLIDMREGPFPPAAWRFLMSWPDRLRLNFQAFTRPKTRRPSAWAGKPPGVPAPKALTPSDAEAGVNGLNVKKREKIP